ncbi:MAG: GMC oxidoreductase [Myxococcota bacterium]
MSEPIVVVGSGPSGLHFAQTLLEKGHAVRLLDVGHPRPDAALSDLDLDGLKRSLPDPTRYFLGDRWQSLVLPGEDSEYYGFPPSKDYVFRGVDGFEWRASGFEPLLSFAAGGLAEAWTGGCYPFHDGDLLDFPFDYAALAPHYARVAARIGISGVADDLAGPFPVHAGLQPPLDLDLHSATLLERYEHHRQVASARLQCRMGRARLATLSRPHAGRAACSYTGRCLWGCPSDALYTPAVTLRECLGHPRFEYLPGRLVSHFRFSQGGRIHQVIARRAADGAWESFDVARLVLAAGTLATSRIVLESIRRDSAESVELGGLMDNRQVLMPFVNLRLIGRPFESASYQYHQLAIGFDPGGPAEYVHGLVTTLKSALVHPIVAALPTSIGSGLRLFRDLHAALGLVNINFSDRRREENRLGLELQPGSRARLAIDYSPAAGEAARVRRATRRFRRLLWQLDCVAPPWMTRMRPMGASVHYAGTLPMTSDPRPLTTDPQCRSRDFPNLWIADGATFPSLPAKNLTFTLMANATRIAEESF